MTRFACCVRRYQSRRRFMMHAQVRRRFRNFKKVPTKVRGGYARDGQRWCMVFSYNCATHMEYTCVTIDFCVVCRPVCVRVWWPLGPLKSVISKDGSTWGSGPTPGKSIGRRVLFHFTDGTNWALWHCAKAVRFYTYYSASLSQREVHSVPKPIHHRNWEFGSGGVGGCRAYRTDLGTIRRPWCCAGPYIWFSYPVKNKYCPPPHFQFYIFIFLFFRLTIGVYIQLVDT